MNRAILAAAGLFLALLAALAQAQMYRWVDQQGRVRYTDTPPPASAKGTRKLPAGESAAPAPAAAAGEGAAAKDAKPLEVTLYTNSGCGQLCSDARAYLASRGVKFREVEVETAEALDELQKVAGVMSVPALRVGETVQRGYDETRYARMLDAAGYPKADPARAVPAPRAPAGPYAPGAAPPKKK